MHNNKKAYLLGFGFAVLYFLIERGFNECVLFNAVFKSAELGYKVSGRASLLVWALFAAWVLWKKFKLNWKAVIPLFAVGGYFACLAFSTWLNGLGFNRLLNVVLNTMSVLLLIIMACDRKETAKIFVSSLTWLYIACTGLNALSMLIPPFANWCGMHAQECFIGNFDTSGFAVELGMFYALLDAHLNGHKTKLYAYIAFFALDIAAVFSQSGTTVIGAALIALYLLLPFLRKWVEKTDFLFFAGMGFAFFTMLMWLYEPITNWGPVRAVLENVLHKDVTLSDRTLFWPLILVQYIYKKPLFGYGLDVNSFIGLEDFYDDGRIKIAYHTNNQILQTWYEGGLVALAVIIVLLIITAAVLRKCKDRKLAGIVKWMLFVFLIVYNSDIMPGFNWTYVFEIIVLAVALIYGKEREQNQ